MQTSLPSPARTQWTGPHFQTGPVQASFESRSPDTVETPGGLDWVPVRLWWLIAVDSPGNKITNPAALMDGCPSETTQL